nr:hypothetical protein [Tanacetum cinerariifolium]
MAPSGRDIFVLSGDEPIILLDPRVLRSTNDRVQRSLLEPSGSTPAFHLSSSHLHSTSYIIISRQAAATWQPPIGQPPVTWHPVQRRSMPVNDAGPPVKDSGLRWRSAVNGGDRRSMVAVNDDRRGGPSLTTAGPPLTTIGQRWLIGRVRSGAARKAKGVKARLNFEEASRYSELETPSRRRNLKERLGPREYSRRTKAVSESEGSAGGHWKSKPKKQKLSVEDNLSQLWVCEEIDHFTPWICYFDFRKTQMPSHIKTYDKSEDPEDHLKIFQAAAKTECWAMPTWCHMFNSTLTKNARVWFNDLPKESIDSYDDLRKAFLENYLRHKKCIKDPIEIHNIKQRDGESTKEFVRRYKLKCRDVKGALECMKISRFMYGITNSELIKRLHDKIPKSMDEMMSITIAFLRGKRQIEEMLKAGKLSHSIKELRKNHGKDQAKIAKNGETSRKDKLLAILIVRPWQRISRQRITQTFSLESVISFPSRRGGMEGPMIIEAEIGGHCMHRIYVDEGSSSEILYEHCFSKFRLEIKNQLIPANTPLVGFSGETIWPLGQISLLVKNFVVVRSPSPYNGIIGRPGVRKIRAIPSTAHGMLKFPVAGGIVTLRSSRIIPLECSMVLEPGVPRPIINQVMEEKIQLRRHFDVFAWKPADMTGVPRHIAEHRLNVREGCLPVRQKKREQAPERNKAIGEELKNVRGFQGLKQSMPQKWLSAIVNRLEEKSLPFFKTLKMCTKKSDFQWTAEAEMAFKGMKQLIAELPMLTTPKENKELIMYLAAAKEAISAVLMTERDGKQVPIYFVSRALQGPEINYTRIKKLILTLVRAGNGKAAQMEVRTRRARHSVPTKDVSKRKNSGGLHREVSGGRHTIIINEGQGRTPRPMDIIHGQIIMHRQFWSRINTHESERNGIHLRSKPARREQKRDALSKIESTSFAHLSKQMLVEELKEKSIDIVEEEGHTWMTLVYEYLTEGILPEEKQKAKAVRRKAGRYAVINEVLYKKSFLGPWLRCVGPLQANYILREIHEGSCSMHARPRSVVAKALGECNDCQIHHPVPRNLQEKLTPITSPWPFYKWGIDIAGPFPKGPGKVKFLIVAMDYFTKWIEARPVAIITGAQSKQKPRRGIKAQLVDKNKNWVEKISHVLWAHRTMINSSNGETSFSLTYGAEAVIPAKIGMPTLRTVKVDMVKNNEAFGISLDLLEEKREQAAIQEARSKAKMERLQRQGPKHKLSSRRLCLSKQQSKPCERQGKLGPKWEGPYEVTEALGKVAYRQRDRNGHTLL